MTHILPRRNVPLSGERGIHLLSVCCSTSLCAFLHHCWCRRAVPPTVSPTFSPSLSPLLYARCLPRTTFHMRFGHSRLPALNGIPTYALFSAFGFGSLPRLHRIFDHRFIHVPRRTCAYTHPCGTSATTQAFMGVEPTTSDSRGPPAAGGSVVFYLPTVTLLPRRQAPARYTLPPPSPYHSFAMA